MTTIVVVNIPAPIITRKRKKGLVFFLNFQVSFISSTGAMARNYPKATVLYTPDIENVTLDVILDSSWCFTSKVSLEEGVSMEFKAGNSVSCHIHFFKY